MGDVGNLYDDAKCNLRVGNKTRRLQRRDRLVRNGLVGQKDDSNVPIQDSKRGNGGDDGDRHAIIQDR